MTKFSPRQLEIVNLITDEKYTVIRMPYRLAEVAFRAISQMRLNGSTVNCQYTAGRMLVIRGGETNLQRLARHFAMSSASLANLSWTDNAERVRWVNKKFPETVSLTDRGLWASIN